MNLSLRSSDAKHGSHAIARAIACGIMLLVLPSCGIPPLRHPDPGPGLPTNFSEADSPENSAQLPIDEFYNDRMLTCLIEKALFDNRELKILNEEVAMASNEVLARSGAYLPFISVAAGSGLTRFSRFTQEGAGNLDDPYLGGRLFGNPVGNYLGGLQFTWQLDIYRQLRNARDAAGQRYVAAAERRNYFVTTLIADIAENFYRLMGLDKRLENLNQIIELQASCGSRPSFRGTTAKS
jgi:multidrug efflux system outer membrane protein